MSKSKYANKELKRIYGHSSNITFIFGERGVGKTYWFKLKALKLAVKGISTLFLRRFANEADYFRRQFFSDIPKETLDTLGVQDWQIKPYSIIINGQSLIKVIALNNESTTRGVISSLKPGFIYFDEINSLKGQFVRNEPTLLASIAEGFFRSHKHKIFLASNYTLPSNPYFERFNITQVKKLFLNKGKIEIVNLTTKSPSYGVKHGLNEERILNNTALVTPVKNMKLTEVFNLKYFNTLYKVVKYKNYYVLKRSFKLPKTKVFSLTGNDGLPQYRRAINWYLPNFPIATILGLVRVNSKNDLFILNLLQ